MKELPSIEQPRITEPPPEAAFSDSAALETGQDDAAGVERESSEEKLNELLDSIEKARAELNIVAEAKAATPNREEAPKPKKAGLFSRMFGRKPESGAAVPTKRSEEYRALGATEYRLKMKLKELEAELEDWKLTAPDDLKKIAEIRLSLDRTSQR